ncbi:capsule assembly Wzi family protein [Parapedobacter sp. 10938]|uniref:capsule assembly Wzi family protein n=1 Tax=Parapedobacter flavus TaxID=3110225 RepID=UPI002DBBE8E7|nr:capsule assembly Wzi family protein [Parapedobacter sp. 10938]MEC3879330.1 capsule assembly Wzi family protein [Parapedobacter sp. 10938]
MRVRAHIRGLLIGGIMFFLPMVGKTQWADSLLLNTGSIVSVASRSFQPLWVESNRFGTISENGKDITLYLGAKNKHEIRVGERSIALQYGINLINNNNFSHTTIQQGYVKVRYKSLEFRAGRYEEILGDVDPLLSTGSLGISGNALPIPKIGFALTEYTPVPFTNGWLYFKGVFSHGWMESNRYMKRTLLHEKSLYGRLGKGVLSVYGGAQHFALWGGERDDFKLDRSFRGFMDVLLVREANDGSLDEEIYPNKRPNKAGDQRGLLEFGLDVETEALQLHFYHQTPFESGKGIDFRNQDRLAGLSIAPKKHRWLDRVLLEFIHTKQMEAFDDRERQSYYENGVYTSGWTYHNRIIGTPLFMNRFRGANFLDIEPSIPGGNQNMVNNRVVGGHLGMVHRYSRQVRGKTLLSFTRNFGTHNTFISTAQNQFYSLHEVSFCFRKSPKLRFSGAVALDTGDFYNNVGGLLGVNYIITSN